MWQFITEYWAGWLCALIGGAILAAIPKIKALWDAVLALLHDRIYTECYRFMELGYITRDGLRNLNYLYKTYHVMGGNGTGKSTTLRMIAGLERLSGGNLYMDGRLVNDVPCGERNVSMVFQNYALFPHMTVQSNIVYGLKAHKMDPAEIKTRLSEVLDMLDLKGLEERRPKDLSGGQRQRVALARAVVKRSDYFLLDEPLSNLDAQLRLRARKELVKIHEMYHQTLIYVTHDQIEAMTVGQRIALMHEGKCRCWTPLPMYTTALPMYLLQNSSDPPP